MFRLQARLERLERLEAKETMRPDEEDLRSAALALEASKLARARGRLQDAARKVLLSEEGCRSVPEEPKPGGLLLFWLRCCASLQELVLAVQSVRRSAMQAERCSAA